MVKKKNEFLLQWHITAKCQQHCKHCYMYDEPTYKGECENELSFEQCIKVLDDYKSFCERMNVNGRITFTGGDPLLREDIYEIIIEARKREFVVGILGNPFLINSELPLKLRELGIHHYQLSLDGLEQTHDSLRKKGSYKATLHSIKLLKEAGIVVHIMNTLSNVNSKELLPLMKVVGELEVDVFAFGRLTCNGSGKEMRNASMNPQEYRRLLEKVDAYSKELRNSGIMTNYVHKCHLWKLLMYERGDFELVNDKETIYGGCSIGISGLVLLADGTAMACRRFPSYVGKVPESSIYDIFMSEKMNEYRKVHKLEKCSNCELFQICRGCPAVSYGMTGSWTAPDPQCWKFIS